MQAGVTVLVVDDQEDIRDLLDDYLSQQGYRVFLAADGVEMRAQLEVVAPDLVILDVGLPGEDGLSLARYIRENLDIGVIMVSGAGDTMDRIIGLEVGADDYLAKPFELRELLARTKSVLRRYQPRPGAHTNDSTIKDSSKFKFGNCVLDTLRHQLEDAEGNEIAITAMEFDLLKVFAEHPNRPLSRDQLLDFTQNRDWDPNDRSIDIRVARLRRKIEPNPDKPQVIKTVRGTGYLYVTR
jgi:DNA-binding response OmpR family regulator